MVIGVVEQVGPAAAQIRIRRPYFLAAKEVLPWDVEPGDEVELEISPVRRVEEEAGES
jgi:hypothetical protein